MRSLVYLSVGSSLLFASCGRVDFDAVSRAGDASADGAGASDAGGLPLLHRYSFHGTYADDLGGPDIVGLGGTVGTAGYTFGSDQGLRLTNAMPSTAYTVDIDFQLGQLGGWRKILDFDGLVADSGLYVYDGALQFVIVSEADFLTTTVAELGSGAVRMTMTRDPAGEVTGYLNGVPALAARSATAAPPPTPPATPFAFSDPTNVAKLAGSDAYFFVDDTATNGNESSAGSVTRIRIYEGALTAAQVQAQATP